MASFASGESGGENLQVLSDTSGLCSELYCVLFQFDLFTGCVLRSVLVEEVAIEERLWGF